VKRLIERLDFKVLCGCFLFEAVMPEHREAQKDNLGDLPLHAMFQISEETLSNKELFDGMKDESGNFVGDIGRSEHQPKEFQHY